MQEINNTQNLKEAFASKGFLMEQIIMISLAYALVGVILIRPVLAEMEKILTAELFERLKGKLVLIILVIWPVYLLAFIVGRTARFLKGE